jgi:hypothetical protein
VSAWTPREALEKRRPQAFGRYRVVMLGEGEPEKLFEAVGTPQGCRISEVDPAHGKAVPETGAASNRSARHGGTSEALAPDAAFGGGPTMSLVPTFDRPFGGD